MTEAMAFYLIIPSEASLTNVSAYRLLAPNTRQIAYNKMGPKVRAVKG